MNKKLFKFIFLLNTVYHKLIYIEINLNKFLYQFIINFVIYNKYKNIIIIDSLIASGTASIIEVLTTHPLDYAKTLQIE